MTRMARMELGFVAKETEKAADTTYCGIPGPPPVCQNRQVEYNIKCWGRCPLYHAQETGHRGAQRVKER